MAYRKATLHSPVCNSCFISLSNSPLPTINMKRKTFGLCLDFFIIIMFLFISVWVFFIVIFLQNNSVFKCMPDNNFTFRVYIYILNLYKKSVFQYLHEKATFSFLSIPGISLKFVIDLDKWPTGRNIVYFQSVFVVWRICVFTQPILSNGQHHIFCWNKQIPSWHESQVSNTCRGVTMHCRGRLCNYVMNQL